MISSLIVLEIEDRINLNKRNIRLKSYLFQRKIINKQQIWSVDNKHDCEVDAHFILIQQWLKILWNLKKFLNSTHLFCLKIKGETKV